MTSHNAQKAMYDVYKIIIYDVLKTCDVIKRIYDVTNCTNTPVYDVYKYLMLTTS